MGYEAECCKYRCTLIYKDTHRQTKYKSKEVSGTRGTPVPGTRGCGSRPRCGCGSFVCTFPFPYFSRLFSSDLTEVQRPPTVTGHSKWFTPYPAPFCVTLFLSPRHLDEVSTDPVRGVRLTIPERAGLSYRGHSAVRMSLVSSEPECFTHRGDTSTSWLPVPSFSWDSEDIPFG